MADALFFVAGSNTVTPSKAVNQILTVQEVESPTSFLVDLPDGGVGSLSAGTVETFAASPSVFDGPYIWDPQRSVALTGLSSSLTEEIVAGTQVAFLSIASTEDFPDEDGWLVFGFGTAHQTGPVKYLGRRSTTQLNLDYLYVFPRDVPAGSKVNFIRGRDPFLPASSDVGTFWLTASNSGRVSAQATVEEITAAGIDATITVAYPGDKGLGGEGYPVSGEQKLSDRVGIWGSDSPDVDTQEAREE